MKLVGDFVKPLSTATVQVVRVYGLSLLLCPSKVIWEPKHQKKKIGIQPKEFFY